MNDFHPSRVDDTIVDPPRADSLRVHDFVRMPKWKGRSNNCCRLCGHLPATMRHGFDALGRYPATICTDHNGGMLHFGTGEKSKTGTCTARRCGTIDAAGRVALLGKREVVWDKQPLADEDAHNILCNWVAFEIVPTRCGGCGGTGERLDVGIVVPCTVCQ